MMTAGLIIKYTVIVYDPSADKAHDKRRYADN